MAGALHLGCFGVLGFGSTLYCSLGAPEKQRREGKQRGCEEGQNRVVPVPQEHLPYARRTGMLEP